MNLGKNISSLLRRYAEVYVPGIGVFKRIHSPAQFDKQHNVFLPPISYVELDYSAQQGFNIVHYIQQQENLGLDQAQHILEEAVDGLRADLGQFGQVKLDDLGLLISYGSSLVFKPLDLSGFDFQPVTNLVGPEIETVIPALEEEREHTGARVLTDEAGTTEEPEEVQAEAVPLTNEPEAAAEVEPLIQVPEEDLAEEKSVLEPESIPASKGNAATEEAISSKSEQGAIAVANASYTPDSYEEEDEPQHSNVMWYWITGAIVVVMAVAAVFYINPSLRNSVFGGSQPVAKSSADSVSQQTTPIGADSSSNVSTGDSLKLDGTPTAAAAGPAQAGVKTGTEKPAIMQADPVIKESIPVAQPKYQVVIGSAKTMAQAEQEAQRLRSMGYKTARAVEGKSKRSRKKVILNTYMTKEEATLAQKSIEKSIKDAWVDAL